MYHCYGYHEEEILDTYGGVGQLLLHVITTDIIEIAADGKTAKCFWYTPGIVAETGQNIVGNDDDPTETYRMWSADRLVSEMATVLIPTEYDTWSWDDQNFGPSKTQWQTLIASEGWSDILAEWDAAH